MSERLRFLRSWTWTAGLTLALTGGLAVRLWVPSVATDQRALALVASQCTALAGLLVIVWGISRKLNQRSS